MFTWPPSIIILICHVVEQRSKRMKPAYQRMSVLFPNK